MKQKFFTYIKITFPFFLLFPFQAFANPVGDRMKEHFAQLSYWSGFQADKQFPGDRFVPFLGAYINGIFGLLGIIFLLWVILGGWWWMTAGGNEEKVEKGKKAIVSASLGLGIIFFSMVITNFIFVILDQSITP